MGVFGLLKKFLCIDPSKPSTYLNAGMAAEKVSETLAESLWHFLSAEMLTALRFEAAMLQQTKAACVSLFVKPSSVLRSVVS